MFETDLLGDLIQRKRSLLAQLRGMGEKQFELVQNGEITRLLELLAAKQHVLLQLQQLERQLDRFRGDDPEQRQWSSPRKREQCLADQSECERLLAEIMIQEKRSEQELVRRRDEAAAQLSRVAWAGQARDAYTDQPLSSTTHLDLVSES